MLSAGSSHWDVLRIPDFLKKKNLQHASGWAVWIAGQFSEAGLNCCLVKSISCRQRGRVENSLSPFSSDYFIIYPKWNNSDEILVLQTTASDSPLRTPKCKITSFVWLGPRTRSSQGSTLNCDLWWGSASSLKFWTEFSSWSQGVFLY